jgi:hypothetical protein
MSRNTSKKKQERNDFLESVVFSKNQNERFSKLSKDIPISELYDDYEKEKGKSWQPYNSVSLEEKKKFEESCSKLENIIMKRVINVENEGTLPLKAPHHHFHHEIKIPYSKIINEYDIDSNDIPCCLITKKKELDYLFKLSSYNCFEEYILPKTRKKNTIEFTIEGIKKYLYENCDDMKLICILWDENTKKYLLCSRMDDMQDLMFLCMVVISKDENLNVVFQTKSCLYIEEDVTTYKKISDIVVKFDYYFYFSCGCGK